MSRIAFCKVELYNFFFNNILNLILILDMRVKYEKTVNKKEYSE